MRKPSLLFASLSVTLCSAATLCSADAIAAPPAVGETVFETGFETAEARAAWSAAAFATWDAGFESERALRVTVPAEAAHGSHMVEIPLDVVRYRGCKLGFTCKARADGATKPPASWLGVKYMFHVKSKSFGPSWTNEGDVFGTFDWRTLEFVVVIPPDAEDGVLSLGLQDSAGTVWFDDLRVRVLKPPRPPRPQPIANPPPAFKGHDLPRLRGAMSPSAFREEDIRVLGREWNANVIRWQIVRNWGQAGTERDLAEYGRWIDAKLEEFDAVLDSCRRHGVKVVIDLHSPPGGRYENKDMAMFFEKPYQDSFVALWERIASRFKGHPAVWGYDLVNEPTQTKPSPDGVADCIGAQVLAAQAIRGIDPATPIFITSGQWGSAEGFRELDPVPISNVVYQVHFYSPHEFTHQGVGGEWKPVKYPGTISGVEWNEARIRAMLQPVREFQLAYNAHIYVGEFSAARWAPGAADYLRDCIAVFEDYGWDWTYHAYREWDGWSLEHVGDPKNGRRADTSTDRLELLLGWFKKNVAP